MLSVESVIIKCVESIYYHVSIYKDNNYITSLMYVFLVKDSTFVINIAKEVI